MEDWGEGWHHESPSRVTPTLATPMDIIVTYYQRRLISTTYAILALCILAIGPYLDMSTRIQSWTIMVLTYYSPYCIMYDKTISYPSRKIASINMHYTTGTIIWYIILIIIGLDSRVVTELSVDECDYSALRINSISWVVSNVVWCTLSQQPKPASFVMV